MRNLAALLSFATVLADNSLCDNSYVRVPYAKLVPLPADDPDYRPNPWTLVMEGVTDETRCCERCANETLCDGFDYGFSASKCTLWQGPVMRNASDSTFSYLIMQPPMPPSPPPIPYYQFHVEDIDFGECRTEGVFHFTQTKGYGPCIRCADTVKYLPGYTCRDGKPVHCPSGYVCYPGVDNATIIETKCTEGQICLSGCARS